MWVGRGVGEDANTAAAGSDLSLTPLDSSGLQYGAAGRSALPICAHSWLLPPLLMFGTRSYCVQQTSETEGGEGSEGDAPSTASRSSPSAIGMCRCRGMGSMSPCPQESIRLARTPETPVLETGGTRQRTDDVPSAADAVIGAHQARKGEKSSSAASVLGGTGIQRVMMLLAFYGSWFLRGYLRAKGGSALSARSVTPCGPIELKRCSQYEHISRTACYLPTRRLLALLRGFFFFCLLDNSIRSLCTIMVTDLSRPLPRAAS